MNEFEVATAAISYLLGLDSSGNSKKITPQVMMNKLGQDMSGKDLNDLNTFTIGMAGDGVSVTNDGISTSGVARFYLHMELMYNFAIQIEMNRSGVAKLRMRTGAGASQWQEWKSLQ